ncbi:hypothetical protein N7474_008378 [Penicillium riverlandense]|uniref:uncharacterized protein n=1 Tax=Penicillium riverlandense TaxID=1903569 RepID=UPI002547B015|nr:uncharacterized protein N7474_008378 [Penicillium riverlandense]KAJ5812077.1 hypothetical protein N7474_008378 [Penicillium riverlandense]
MPSPTPDKVTKLKAKRPSRRVRPNLPLVERTNALTIEEFISHYVDPSTTPAVSNGTRPSPRSDVYSAASISRRNLEACLDLVEQTSAAAYAASSMGWSRSKKRQEMLLPDMKFMIMRGDGADTTISPNNNGNNDDNDQSSASAKEGPVLGFLSFMVTYEDGKEVIYCYEIHLSPAARGRGLGKELMERMERIGRAVGVEKAMLTVFKSNETACRFYDRLGYEVDEYSPQPRRLRNGTIKADYLILSKRLKK